MPAGRVAGRHDAVGIDAEPGGVCAHEADRALGVLDALDGLDVLAAGHTVVGGDRDHAPRGQVFALRQELLRRAAGPATAKEEDDGRALVARLAALGRKDVELELRVAGGLVGFDRRARHVGRIGEIQPRGVFGGGRSQQRGDGGDDDKACE